jgi:hypothetical protein
VHLFIVHVGSLLHNIDVFNPHKTHFAGRTLVVAFLVSALAFRMNVLGAFRKWLHSRPTWYRFVFVRNCVFFYKSLDSDVM